LSREQIRWADSALAVPARWRFVVLHHPLVTSGHYLSDWKFDDSSPAEVQSRARLLEICRRRGVTAVLAGHEHLYQRTYVRGRDGKGFWHITTGGGGSPLYRLSENERKAALKLTLPDSSHVTWSRARSMYHYCRLILTRHANPMDDVAELEVNRVRSNGEIIEIDRLDLTSIPELEKSP
jgi:3',5'-cyclic AMP phosphodiesterase CpdA